MPVLKRATQRIQSEMQRTLDGGTPLNLAANSWRHSVSYEAILSETQDRVGIITINRPQRLNALNDDHVAEIRDQIDLLE